MRKITVPSTGPWPYPPTPFPGPLPPTPTPTERVEGAEGRAAAPVGRPVVIESRGPETEANGLSRSNWRGIL